MTCGICGSVYLEKRRRVIQTQRRINTISKYLTTKTRFLSFCLSPLGVWYYIGGGGSNEGRVGSLERPPPPPHSHSNLLNMAGSFQISSSSFPFSLSLSFSIYPSVSPIRVKSNFSILGGLWPFIEVVTFVLASDSLESLPIFLFLFRLLRRIRFSICT